jgi:hypothetical protein
LSDRNNNSGGNLQGIQALLTVNGNDPTTGSDYLNVDDTGDTQDNVGVLTSTTITGLGMTGSINYQTIEHLLITLGAGNDTFTINSTHGAATPASQEDTTIKTGAGSDAIVINNVTDLLFVSGENDPDTITVNNTGLNSSSVLEGNEGNDTFNILAMAGNVEVKGGLGDDLTNVGNTFNLVDEISATLTVSGNDGDDTLNVNDLGDTKNNVGQLTSTTISGLDMTGVIIYDTQETVNINLGTGNDTFTIVNTHTQVTNLSGNDGAETIDVEAIAGNTNITAGLGDDTVNVGNPDNLVDNIAATLTVSGNDGRDTLNVNDSGDTNNNVGQLTATTVSGLDMAGAIVYDTQETLNITLGSGNDNFTIDSTHTQLTNLTTGAGVDNTLINAVQSMTNYFGGTGDDIVTVDQLPSLTSVNNGVRDTLNLDGQQGEDDYIVNITGAGDYIINVFDTEANDSERDELTVFGTNTVDKFLLRASEDQTNGVAFVAALHNTPISEVERINYNLNLEYLKVDAQGGDDSVTLDDNWAETDVLGGTGSDQFQVGQIFKTERNANAGVADQDIFETIATTRGFLSNGVSFQTTIDGGADNDQFIVFRNKAELNLNGNTGDDLFVIRAFAEEGSQESSIATGEGADTIEYVVNAIINVDGGDGNDTLKLIGTEFGDKFLVTDQFIQGAGRTVTYTNIENIIIDAAEGDDSFYVFSTKAGVITSLFGGLGNDTFRLGGDAEAVVSSEGTVPAQVGPHQVNGIQGELIIDGFGGDGSAGGLGDPVMLPGETNQLLAVGNVLSFEGTGLGLAIDTMTVETADLQAFVTEQNLANIASLIGLVLEISSGNGRNRFWQIVAVNIGMTGETTLSLENPALPAAEWTLPDGESEYAITTLSPNFFISEEQTRDVVTLYEDGSQDDEIGSLTANSLQGLDLIL